MQRVAALAAVVMGSASAAALRSWQEPSGPVHMGKKHPRPASHPRKEGGAEGPERCEHHDMPLDPATAATR